MARALTTTACAECACVSLLFVWGRQKELKAASKESQALGKLAAKEDATLKTKKEKGVKDQIVNKTKAIEGEPAAFVFVYVSSVFGISLSVCFCFCFCFSFCFFL